MSKYRGLTAVAAMATIAFASLFGPSAAYAACAIAVGEGSGASVQAASYRARQNAVVRAYQSGAAGSQLDISQPACSAVDDFQGGLRATCEVQASWCTTPVAAAPPPHPPRNRGIPLIPRPRYDPGPHLGSGPVPAPDYRPRYRHNNRRHACRTITAQASGYSVRGAQSLVYRTLDQALRARTGRSLQSHGVSAAAPGCYYLEGYYARANIVQCQMTAEVCE